MPLLIHKTDISPPARATLMVVEILGLDVETREVNLPTREQYKPEYLKKNPIHSVPLLEDGDLILADSHAIITYLVSKYGGDEQTLYPKDVTARAIVHQRLFFDASILFPRLRTAIYSLVVFREPGLTDAQVSDITECYEVTEKYLTKEFLAGNELTLADISCVATLSSLNCFIPIDKKYVKLHQWWGTLKRLSWYQKVNEPGLKLFDGFIKQFL